MQPKKQIGLWTCVTFAVGAMVGAGVFVLSGVAVQQAGPAALLAFGLAGLAVLCSAFSFVVIASLAQPGQLGYAPVGQILGHQFWGFLTAWAFYLSAIISSAFVLHAFGEYLHDFFAPSIPALGWAIAATLGLALLNLGSSSNVGRAETLLVILKVSVLLALIAFGAGHLQASDLSPFAPHGGNAVLATSGLLFIAYLGFSVVTNIAGDVRNAQRTVPRAILISIGIVILLYIGVVLALLAYPLAHYDEASVGVIAAHLMGPIGSVLVPLAALVSTLSAANSNILGSSEIMVHLAARKDVPTALGQLRNGHPLISVLFGATVCILLLASGQTNTVIALANVAAIAAILLINCAALRLVLRKNHTKAHLIGGPLFPVLGAVSCFVELYLLGIGPVALGLLCLAGGGMLYLVRRAWHNPAEHRRLIAELQEHGGPALRFLRRFESRPR